MSAFAWTAPVIGARRCASFAVGAVFGLTLSWSGMTNPTCCATACCSATRT